MLSKSLYSSLITAALLASASSAQRFASGTGFSFDTGEVDTDPWDQLSARDFGEPRMNSLYTSAWDNQHMDFSMTQFRRQLGIVHLKKGYLHHSQQTRLKALAKRKKKLTPMGKKTKVRGIVIVR